MPKRRHRKPPPATTEERRARGERVVHREEMAATLGEVLEHEHTDDAIRLLYKQDELKAATSPPPPAKAVETHARSSEPHETPHEAGPAVSSLPPKRRGLTRFLSPAFVARAASLAAGELFDGAARAWSDLHEAARRARVAFMRAPAR